MYVVHGAKMAVNYYHKAQFVSKGTEFFSNTKGMKTLKKLWITSFDDNIKINIIPRAKGLLWFGLDPKRSANCFPKIKSRTKSFFNSACSRIDVGMCNQPIFLSFKFAFIKNKDKF